MICPTDRTPLIPHKRDGVEARSCLQCHGVWFSRIALETLAKKSPQPATAESHLSTNATSFVMRRLACPVCAGAQLQTCMQGGIEISRCRDCGGIWLAKTEVAKILAARKSQPKANAASCEADAADEEGIVSDLAAGMVDATPLVALETGGEIGTAVGDFLVSFLG